MSAQLLKKERKEEEFGDYLYGPLQTNEQVEEVVSFKTEKDVPSTITHQEFEIIPVIIKKEEEEDDGFSPATGRSCG